MSTKSFIAQLLARLTYHKVQKWAQNPIEAQQKVFRFLIKSAKKTQFGKDHHFDAISNYDAFKKNVPIRDYEGLKPYVNQIIAGNSDVLWKGKPIYFAKTSGTTSGAKYIPITKASMPHHIEAAKQALLLYIYETDDASWVDGKMIFLQGSPVLEQIGGIQLGRLSGIVAHYVPKYLQENRLPSWETNCIEDWEAKIDKIVSETINENMTVISGIPSWVQMYFERLIAKSNKSISTLFPNFNLFIYGGVNFVPYRKKFEQLIRKKIDCIELYPASEGFIAYQDKQDAEGMLLLLNNGIFYEFIPAATFFDENPERISLRDVQLDVNYVIILNTDAGLWGYNIGDTVQFTSLKPYRIKVTGRIKHFISAFGEHVIGKEVDEAIAHTISILKEVRIVEFTVAPQVNPKEGLPYHEWFVEFENEPEENGIFEVILDARMQFQNEYYKNLVEGTVLEPLQVRKVQKGGFNKYMKSIGKLGGQNKIPRLSDNRKIAEALQEFLID